MPVDKVLTVAEATKAAKAKPADASAQADLAVSYLYARKPKEAEKAAREALAIEPNQTRALAVLGTLLAAKDETWPQAKDLLLRLAELDPTSAAAPKLLAQRALKEGRRDLAIFWFNRLKLASPYDPMSYTGLAGIFLDDKQNEKALPELAELARREQSDPKYALKMAELYSLLGKPDQAVVWLDEAMHIDPFKPEIHKDLAVAYLGVAQPDKAVDEMKVAIQLDPDNAHYWARLAFIYDANDKRDLAVKAAEFSVRLDPTSPARDLLKRGAPTTQPAALEGPASSGPGSATTKRGPPAPAPEPPVTIDLPVEEIN